MAPRCYVASPLGFTESGRHYNQHVLIPALAAVVEPIDPWAAPGSPADGHRGPEPGLARPRRLALDIGRGNAQAIRSCALLVALLEGQEIDSGTAAEVGYAAALGLTCFGLRSDLRRHGEDGVTVNLQVEAFIEDSGGEVVGSLDALVRALAAIPPL